MPQDHLPDWLREWRLDTGRRIRDARLHANLSQEQLAHHIGIARMTINRIELGVTSPPLDRILLIAHELDVSPASLLPDLPP